MNQTMLFLALSGFMNYFARSRNIVDSKKDVIMLSQFFNEEKKERIIGFHALSDGSFLKVYNNQHIEICIGFSSNFIKIKEAPTRLPNKECSLIAELPNQHLALAYSLEDRGLLVILDLKNGTYVANKAMITISSLITLANGFMLINADTLCIYENNCLTTTRADEFINFRRTQTFDNRDDDMSFSKTEYLPLLGQPGFIYFDRHYQSTIKVITDRFEQKAEFQFRASPFFHLAPRVAHGDCNALSEILGFCYGSHIVDIRPLSNEHFACLTRNVYYKKSFKYCLYIIDTDLRHFHQTTLTGIKHKSEWEYLKFDNIFRLDDQHVAYMNVCDYGKICVKIYNLKCEEIGKIIIDKRMVEHYIAVAPNGQLVTCSLDGEIVIHNTSLNEKLKNEMKSVLIKNNMPTELVSIVTEYAGFFDRNREVPMDAFKQIEYPEEPSFFAGWKTKP